MSLGFGGACRKVTEDDKIVIYEYSVYNLNETDCRDTIGIFDGTIAIDKKSLVEPEIHEKIKKMPSGRKKLITKRIRVEVPIQELFSHGRIRIKNCSHCWQISIEGYGIIALHFIFYIFLRYQEQGELPESLSYNV